MALSLTLLALLMPILDIIFRGLDSEKFLCFIMPKVRSLRAKLAALELKQKSICSTSIDGSSSSEWHEGSVDFLH